MTNKNYYDYIIVGGGVAGTYAAWRILDDAAQTGASTPRVLLLEQKDRIGGRLLSMVPPGIPDTRVEVGGMRYSDAHRWVCSLTEFFEMAFQPLPADRPENIAYSRNTLMRTQDITNPAALPYNLAPDERSKEALSSLVMLSAQRAIQEITGDPKAQPTPETWEKVRYSGRFHGMPLQHVSMRYVLLNTVSLEAFKMQEDLGGYDSVLHTWNAIDGFPWNLGDFARPVQFHHTEKGFDTIPHRCAELATHLGADIRTNMRVSEVTQPEGGDFVLSVVDGANGSEHSFSSEALIMAAPLRSIEILNQNEFFWTYQSPEEALYKTVTPIPLFKLALCYEKPWWQKLEAVDVPGEGLRKITTGKSNTDLPVRQCYYWWTNKDTGRSVILIYDDGVDQQYWAGLRDRDDKRYPYNAKAAGGAKQSALWKEYAAPNNMTLEVHRQLKLLHGLHDDGDVPMPYAASFMDWGEDPFGGGANFWHVGSESVSAAKKIVRPTDQKLFVCGECWSHDQGWVEGSLATCEDMLQNHLGIAQPKWFKPNIGE